MGSHNDVTRPSCHYVNEYKMAEHESNVLSSKLNERKQRRHEWWKRKRRQIEQNSGENNSQPKKKREQSEKVIKKEISLPEKTKNKALRFILFIGNLSFECSEADIRNHFDYEGGLTDVRILTDKITGKSKGCAFLEFQCKKAQKTALRLHQSTLCGRKINVEVTCGGGGKGEHRMTKLKSKIAKTKVKRKAAKTMERTHCGKSDSSMSA